MTTQAARAQPPLSATIRKKPSVPTTPNLPDEVRRAAEATDMEPYYDTDEIRSIDAALHPPTDALPSIYAARVLFQSVIMSISPTHHQHSAFDAVWNFAARYIKRKKNWTEVFVTAKPPWEPAPLMNQTTQLLDLSTYSVMNKPDRKRYTEWYTSKRQSMGMACPRFSYTRYTVEIHYDKLQMWPPGCGPSRRGTATDADAQSHLRRAMSPTEAISLGMALSGALWCQLYRVLVVREYEEVWQPNTGAIEITCKQSIGHLLEAETWPRGEPIFMGSCKDMVGSVTCPNVPENLSRPLRLRHLQKLSTPRTDAEFFNASGFSVGAGGKTKCQSFYNDRRQHSLVICRRTSNGKPQALLHLENPLAGSVDNYLLSIDTPKAITWRKDEAPPIGALQYRAKPRAAGAAYRSKLGAHDQDRATYPHASVCVLALPTAVAATNKYAPGHGNAFGLDASYQGARVAAGHYHMQQYIRAQHGLPPLPPHVASLAGVNPFDHTPLQPVDVKLNVKDTDRISKAEKMITENTAATEVLMIRAHVQRNMLALPAVLLLFALDVITREAAKLRIGMPDRVSEARADDAMAAGTDPSVPDDMDTPMYTLAEDEAAIRNDVEPSPISSVPPPHASGTPFEDRLSLYEAVIDRSFDAYEHVPMENRQKMAIEFIGRLYASNIEVEHRVKTEFEYGIYWLDQCFLPMQGVLEALNDDYQADVPVLEAIERSQAGTHAFAGSHALTHVVFDERTRARLWNKAMVLCSQMIHLQLHTWCGFRGAQYGQLGSFDEYQCAGVHEMHTFHFRDAVRRVNDSMLKDIQSNLGVVRRPLQRYFVPHEAVREMLQEKATLASADNTGGVQTGGVPPPGTPAVPTSAAAQSSTSTPQKPAVPFLLHLTRLANEFSEVEPVTSLLHKSSTKFEEDRRRGGSATMQPFATHNLSVRISQGRRCITISNTHAGGVSRQYKNSFQYIFCILDTSTNDSSGQNNGLASGATITRRVSQQEHVSAYHLSQALIHTSLMWSPVRVRAYWSMRLDPGAAAAACSLDDARIAWRHQDSEETDFYSFYYGSPTNLVGWVHHTDLAAVYHAWWLFKTHPNAGDGVRLLSLEVNHATRTFIIHMNQGRGTRLTWVVDVARRQLRASRVSARLRHLMETPPEMMRKQDTMDRVPLFEEIMRTRSMEWIDDRQGRHMRIATSFAELRNSRRADFVGEPFSAVELHPAACLSYTALYMPFIAMNGGARSLAGNTMIKSSMGHVAEPWTTVGEARPMYALVYPQGSALKTPGPLCYNADGVDELLAFYNTPIVDQDSVLMCRASIERGNGRTLLNGSHRSVHDTTLAAAEATLRIEMARKNTLPTQIQRQQADAELARKARATAQQQVRRVTELAQNAHAAAAAFRIHEEDRFTQEAALREHGVARQTVPGGFVRNEAMQIQGAPVDTVYENEQKRQLEEAGSSSRQTRPPQATYLFEQATLPDGWLEVRHDAVSAMLTTTRVETARGAAPVFAWNAYARAYGQLRAFMWSDAHVREGNTVAFPAWVPQDSTLMRQPILTPQLLALHETRKRALLDQRRVMEYMRKLDGLSLMQPASSSIPDAPPVEYIRQPMRTNNVGGSAVMGVFATATASAQLNLVIAHSKVQDHEVGNKSAQVTGQKGILSEGRAPESMPFTEDGLIPGRVMAINSLPTRRTMSSQCMAVAHTMAVMAPSSRVRATDGDTFQYAPALLADSVDSAASDELASFDSHMRECMEAKKNHLRFGRALHREASVIVHAALTRRRSVLFDMLNTLDSSVDAHVMRECRANIMQRTPSVLLQVCEWMTHPDHGRDFQQRLHLPAATKLNPDDMFRREALKKTFAEEWWQSSEAFKLMLVGGVPAGGVPPPQTPAENGPPSAAGVLGNGMAHAAGVQGGGTPPAAVAARPPQEQLLWHWWKDVHTECADRMKIGDEFWVHLAHDLRRIHEETRLMDRVVADIGTLGASITKDLCHNIQLQRGSSMTRSSGRLCASPEDALRGVSMQDVMDDENGVSSDLDQPLTQRPLSYTDRKRTYDKLWLDLLKITHRLASLWASALTQTDRLQRAVRVFDDDIFKPCSEGALTDFFTQFTAFSTSVRAFAAQHALPHTGALQARVLQQYLQSNQHQVLTDVYPRMHMYLRPAVSEVDTFWTLEHWSTWTTANDTVAKCAMQTPVAWADHVEQMRTYGTSQGLLEPARRHWGRVWAFVLCYSLMHQMTFLPFRVWNETSPVVCVKDFATYMIKTHAARFAYQPSIQPQIHEVAKRIAHARAHQIAHGKEADDHLLDPETRARLGAVEAENEHVMHSVVEYATNGETGTPMLGGLWAGFTRFTFLPKIAESMFKSRTHGAMHIMSGQPAATSDGKGAGRYGRMECSGLAGSGATGLLEDITLNKSDLFFADVCEFCGRSSQYNHKTKQGWCPHCERPSRGQQKKSFAHQFVTAVVQMAAIDRGAMIDRSNNNVEFERLADTFA